MTDDTPETIGGCWAVFMAFILIGVTVACVLSIAALR